MNSQIQAVAIGLQATDPDFDIFNFTEEEKQRFSGNRELIPVKTPFDQRAAILIERNIPVAPLPPRTKAAGTNSWQTLATVDPSKLAQLNPDPDGNTAAVARAEFGGFCFFEVDAPNFHELIEKQTGEKFPDTLLVSSSPGKGRGHFYFKHTVKSIAFQKTADKAYITGKDDSGKEAWSFRMHHAYVVGPLSVKQNADGSISTYTPLKNAPIANCPDWLVDWVSAHTEKTRERVNASEDGPVIPRGSHDTELFRIGCLLRNAGMNYEEIRDALINICERRCENHGSDYVDMCEKKAKSACKYPVGEASPVLILDGKPAGQSVQLPSGRTMQFVRGDSIKPARLKWLWRGRILADKLNVFSGEPDVGKGMTTVDLAARITRHWDFPDCKNELEGPKDVVFLSSEDDMEDTIAPRLIVAGADMSRIHFAQISENTTGTAEEGIVCLDRDLPALEEMIKQYPDTVLIIPDPVIAFLGDADPNKDKDVRPIYSKMKTFAKKMNVGWLFVNHWNKNQNATSINRTSGAKTMVSAPRATWMFTRSPEDRTRYLMMKGKGNLSSNTVRTLAYRIVGQDFDFGDGRGPEQNAVPKLIWDGETDHTTEEVLQTANDPQSRRNTKAEEFLTEFLRDGAKLASEVYRTGDKQALSVDKLKRARYAVDYLAEKIDNRWYWAKSEEDLLAIKTRIYSKGPAMYCTPLKLDTSFR